MAETIDVQDRGLTQASELWSAERARGIVSRIVVEADLKLETPAYLGNGETGEFVDMILLTDVCSDRPMITGATLAGAMRSYLGARANNDSKNRKDKESRSSNTASAAYPLDAASLLFGEEAKEEGGGSDSPLIIDDAICSHKGEIEIRSGVEIVAETGTAKEGHLYTREVWKAGTTFPLRFELVIAEKQQYGGRQKNRGNNYKTRLMQAFLTALHGLDSGEITLGARKTRGYGTISVDDWRFRYYNLEQSTDLLAWLTERNTPLPGGSPFSDFEKDVSKKLGFSDCIKRTSDARCYFRLETEMKILDSILIGGVSLKADESADAVFMSRGQVGDTEAITPIIPGTSLAGVLRMQAARIAGVFHDEKTVAAWMDDLFGRDVHRESPNPGQRKPRASRIRVAESIIKGGRGDLLQRRVSIDPFTGRAADALLFSQRPWFGGETKLECEIKNPTDRDIGLLLMLLKDLWTGFLPIGGNTSVGRGRLQGKCATLTHQDPEKGKRIWRIVQNEESTSLKISWDEDSQHDPIKEALEELEKFSAAFQTIPLSEEPMTP